MISLSLWNAGTQSLGQYLLEVTSFYLLSDAGDILTDDDGNRLLVE